MLTPRRRERVAEVASRRQLGQVVLQDVHDPHNIGAVMRTCDAFGFQRMSIIFEKQKPFNARRLAGTSTAAHKWLDIDTFFSTDDCMDSLHEEGHEIIATVTSGRAESIFDMEVTTPKIALLVGNEHSGLDDRAIELADRHVTIPMVGMVQSLNLSVTTAILLHEVARQRRGRPDIDYALPSEERARLTNDFLKRAENKKVKESRRRRVKDEE